MIQNIVKVKSTTTLQGKKGPYLSVVWTDGDKEFKKNVFEPAHQKVFQQAGKSGESVKVGVEKEGDFWNIKSAEITTEEVEAKPQATKSEQKQTYGKHTAKDSEVESSKRCILMQATLLYLHSTDSGTPFDDDYLERIYKKCSKLIGIDNPLVEEAKKLGAVEKDA